MTLRDTIVRGFNLLVVSIIGLAGFAFAPEMVVETELPYKADDATLFVLGIIAIVWYNVGRNRFKLSAAPVILMVLACAVKIGAIFLEISQADDVGDDFGGVILFVLGLCLVLYQYNKTKKLVSEAGE
jgi:hypothetical protein